MNGREPLDPGMELEDQENELDPIEDLNRALNDLGKTLEDNEPTHPTVDWDVNGGYGLSSGRSPAKNARDSYFSAEQIDNPPTSSGFRSAIRRLISKLFAKRE